MQIEITIGDLKGQARRLRTALAEQQLVVSHVEALNLIARAQGARNWEALEALLKQGTPEQASLSESNQDTSMCADADERWLNWLEAALRMRDVTEQDLDDLLHDIKAPTEASRINNEGMHAQLEALLEWHSTPNVPNPREVLVRWLESTIDGLELPMPESPKGNESLGFAIYAHVTVCAGSRFVRELRMDCLEWFANQSVDVVSRLVVAGIHNTALSDEVALWLEKNSQDTKGRAELCQVLEYMRNVFQQDEDVVANLVGLTVDIDETSVVAFMNSQLDAGVRYSPAALAKVGIK